MTLIWLGALVMALGGLLSLSDRRLRVGAPRPARRRGHAGAGGVGRCGGSRRSHCCSSACWRPAPALAVQPDEMLKDPALEARARALSAELRCLVCQNQSIDDSDAALAHDIRVLLRERLTAGDTDEQVIDYLVARYGEFILLKPRFNGHTLASVAGAAGGPGHRRAGGRGLSIAGGRKRPARRSRSTPPKRRTLPRLMSEDRLKTCRNPRDITEI